MVDIVDVAQVEVVGDYRLRLTFADGSTALAKIWTEAGRGRSWLTCCIGVFIFV